LPRDVESRLFDRIAEQTTLSVQIYSTLNTLRRLLSEKREFLDFLRGILGWEKGSVFKKKVRNRKGGRTYRYYYLRISNGGKRYDIYLGRYCDELKHIRRLARKISSIDRRIDKGLTAMRELVDILRELDDTAKRMLELIKSKKEFRRPKLLSMNS